MDFIFRHKIILLILILVVAGFFWYSSSSEAPANILTKVGTDSSNTADKGLVETLLTLRAVSLSGTILSDPSFRRLRDFSTPITQEPAGRVDPFAPFSGPLAPQAASSSKGTQLFKAGRPSTQPPASPSSQPRSGSKGTQLFKASGL